MPSQWKAWALPEVSEALLRKTLNDQGLVWDGCLHVAATNSLARIMREASTPAISMATLLDLVIWAGMPADRVLAIDRFPTLRTVIEGGTEEFESDLKSWSNEVAGRNLNLGIQADLRLRRYLDREAGNIEASGVLRRSVRDLRRAIQAVATAGFGPGDFDDGDVVLREGLAAWRRIESEVPELFKLRDDVWIDWSDFENESTPQAAQLRSRINSVLSHLLGNGSSRRSIVYHGFYFFTPHQWAWFQLLRYHGMIDQHFIVHDDGRGRAFETWRRYFVDRWHMPRPERVGEPTPELRASLLTSALSGVSVPTSLAGLSTQLIECGSSTKFINLWRWQRSKAESEGRPKPILFAAGTGDIERFVQRLDFDPSSDEVNLAELPIGQFLLALHGCIETKTGGSHRLVLDRARLVDMVSSRLLDVGAGIRDPSHHISAFERAMPFFEDCSLLIEWIERAKVLERLIISEVSTFGRRASGLSDIERIAVAVSNPLRLVPWADLSEIEVSVISETITRVAEMIERVTSVEETRNPDKYLGWIRQQLARGMANLPAMERRVVEDKLRGVSVGGESEFDVEGIIDVVHMLLGRQAEFGLDGDSEGVSVAVRQMRNLDALGFASSQADVHVANLVDTEFPARFQSFHWPFAERLLQTGNLTSPVSAEIFRTREETSALSDLYLFWLALCGVSESATLTLSWITELGTEIRNPSPLVLLIAALDHPSETLRSAVGGLDVETSDQVMMLPADRSLPRLRVSEFSDSDLESAIEKFDPVAASSALACPRRFAIQWAMGSSAAFQAPHTQRILFGNVQDALQKNASWGLDSTAAVRLTKDLWRQFTRGERMSSYVKRRVKAGRASATWEWIYSLGGKRDGTDPIDRAYEAARNGKVPSTEIIAPSAGVLPAPNANLVTERICNMCPVKPRCAVQEHLREGL